MKLHVFAINLEFFFLSCTLGFSCGEVRDILTYCMYFKREIKLLQGFDFLPSHLARMPHFSSFLLDS